MVAAGPAADAVLRIDQAYEGAHGLEEEGRGRLWGFKDGHDLDSNEGYLGLEIFDAGGLGQAPLVLGGEGVGVEAVGAGVLVAGLSATPGAGAAGGRLFD